MSSSRLLRLDAIGAPASRSDRHPREQRANPTRHGRCCFRVVSDVERKANMWLTKTILAPTDFGASSKAASDVALDLARRFQLPLVVVHVTQVPFLPYTGAPFTPVGDYVSGMEQAAREALDAEVARLAGKGVDLRGVLKTGVPWEEILEAQKQVDAGLIVMGTHGRRGLPRALIGSVAEKVVRLSPVPVLTLHAADKD
jgi:nucleotide-binding universal stress UspA family protein